MDIITQAQTFATRKHVLDNQVIRKFEIPATLSFTLNLRKGACVLSVQMQYDKPQMWVLLDKDQPEEIHTFRVQPTGQGFDMEDLGVRHFIGTFQPYAGMVFHLFRTGPGDTL